MYAKQRDADVDNAAIGSSYSYWLCVTYIPTLVNKLGLELIFPSYRPVSNLMYFDVSQNQWSYIELPDFTCDMHWYVKNSFVYDSEVYIFNEDGPDKGDEVIKINSKGEVMVLHDFLPTFLRCLKCTPICAN